MKRISIKDIALKADVSITTVSFIINGKAKERSISQKVIDKVEKIIRESGYKPSQVARSLRTGNSKVIGLIVEDISNPFFSTIARLIENKAYKKGYKIVYSSTENDPAKAKDIINMFIGRNVDAYIIAPMPGIEEEVQKLLNDRKPVMFFDRDLPGIEVPYVGVDHFNASYEAAKSLVEQGKKNIALVTIDLDVKQISDRYDGFRQALQDAGSKMDERYALKVPYEQSDEEMSKSIRHLLLDNQDIDAVLFTTNYLAIKGLTALKDTQRLNDGSLTVLAYDDMPIFKLLTPQISAIEQPLEGIAENVINVILSTLGPLPKPQETRIVLPARLIRR